MKSQTFLCSGMKWCIPWVFFVDFFWLGSRIPWEVADFFLRNHNGKRFRKKKHGEQKLKGFLFLELILYRNSEAAKDWSTWASLGAPLAFWNFLKVFVNPLIPTVRMLRNILPFGWRQNCHFVADCFEQATVVFVLESITPKHTTILWECLQKSYPSNQSSANWCDCPTEKKNKRSVNLFTTHPTKIVNIISLHFSYLSRFMESLGNLNLLPLLFSHKKSQWHQPLTPVLFPSLAFWQSPHRPHPKPRPAAPEPCLLNALDVTKFDVSNLGGSSSAFGSLTFFVLGESQKDKVKTKKKTQKNGWRRLG